MRTPFNFNMHLGFHDVDHLGESIPDWNVEFRQLKKGLFRGHLTQIGREGWVVGQARIEMATEQIGLPPAGMRTIVITGSENASLKWRGHSVGSNELMIFPENGELHAVGDKDFNMKDRALKRFLRYVVINTQSDRKSDSVPSTQGQFDLARLLVDELKELGLQDRVLLTWH